MRSKMNLIKELIKKRNKKGINIISWEKRGTVTSNIREKGRESSSITFNPGREHIKTGKLREHWRGFGNKRHYSSKNSRKAKGNSRKLKKSMKN
jgi:hypothetical protein